MRILSLFSILVLIIACSDTNRKEILLEYNSRFEFFGNLAKEKKLNIYNQFEATKDNILYDCPQKYKSLFEKLIVIKSNSEILIDTIASLKYQILKIHNTNKAQLPLLFEHQYMISDKTTNVILSLGENLLKKLEYYFPDKERYNYMLNFFYETINCTRWKKILKSKKQHNALELYVTLTKLQNDIYQTCYTFGSYTMGQVSFRDWSFHKIEAFSISNSTTIFLNDTFSTKLFIAQIDTTIPMKVTINATDLPLKDEKALYKKKVNQDDIGFNVDSGAVKLLNCNNDTLSLPFELKYEVYK